jgi:hypothetical protein
MVAFFAAVMLIPSAALAADGALVAGDQANVMDAAAPGGLLEVVMFCWSSA